MVEYKKLFLNQMKSLLPYLIKFSENKSILVKEYLNNYIGNSSNQRQMIMTINDKDIFFMNDR